MKPDPAKMKAALEAVIDSADHGSISTLPSANLVKRTCEKALEPVDAKAIGPEVYETYFLIEDWLYPEDSGFQPGDSNIETLDEALERAKAIVEGESRFFSENTGEDPLPPDILIDSDGDKVGVIMTGKSGLSEWYFSVRIFKLRSLCSLDMAKERRIPCTSM